MKFVQIKQILFIGFLFMSTQVLGNVRLKEIGRIDGIRDNQLIGYGLVVGLASTGDSTRNKSTLQSIANTLVEFGFTVNPEDIKTRNVAAVLVTSTLPPFSERGDKIDVKVSSIGDARSLSGGTLIMTPLRSPSGEIYAVAQGALSVGGFNFDSYDSSRQKNHPTVAAIANGALVERSTKDRFISDDGELTYILDNPDFSNLEHVISGMEREFPNAKITPINAAKVKIKFNNSDQRATISKISRLENISFEPDKVETVVINERTGTLVAGADVTISPVTISHGSLKVSIDTKYSVSQPFVIGRSSSSISTEIVPDTELGIREKRANAISMKAGGTVLELIEALKKLNVTTRDIIAIMQTLKKSGALNAQLVIE